MEYQIMGGTVINDIQYNASFQFETLIYKFDDGDQHTSALVEEIASSEGQLRELGFRKRVL
jgi:hypothetical protein